VRSSRLKNGYFRRGGVRGLPSLAYRGGGKKGSTEIGYEDWTQTTGIGLAGRKKCHQARKAKTKDIQVKTETNRGSQVAHIKKISSICINREKRDSRGFQVKKLKKNPGEPPSGTGRSKRGKSLKAETECPNDFAMESLKFGRGGY